MTYRVTIWGARGSIPTPGARTARYGGNTSCVSVETTGSDGDRCIILDAGTGIRPLGKKLIENGADAVSVELLVTHTHWDHIQGLPFFAPFFAQANTVRIRGPKQGDVPLEQILRDQMKPVVFPVPLDELAANLSVEHVGPGTFDVDGFEVQAMQLRHPGVTLGYRLTPAGGGPSFAYVTDNELGVGGVYDLGPGWRQHLIEFVRGSRVMIHDAMYTTAELETHRGWGHSSHVEAVTLAAEAEVETLLLFHHRPEHDDDDMDRFVDEARHEGTRLGSALEVAAAVEGLELTL